MSITLIFTILSFIKKNWKEIILISIIGICFFVILKMGIQIKIKQAKIEKQEVEIVELKEDNEFLEKQSEEFQQKVEDLMNFTNAFSKIKTTTLIEFPDDLIDAYATFSNSFFNTQAGGSNQ